MRTLIITGPSGSGKTYLTKKLQNKFNSLVIETDSYYRDDLFIKVLSKFMYDIYDRIISIKKKKLIETLNSICNKDKEINLYNYDFRRKKSTILVKRNINSQIIILEGIFSHRLGIDYKKAINILCEEKKEICYIRRLYRDRYQRGRTKDEVIQRFTKSWNLYYKYISEYIYNNQIITVNTNKKSSVQNLFYKLQELGIN